MATESAPSAPATTHPLRALIVSELEAIAGRVKAAASTEEKRIVESQYGQRLLHLAARIEEYDAGEAPAAG